MTAPRALLRLPFRASLRSRFPDAPLEWLVTNGIGGYAAGPVEGAPLRRYHGVLVAALPAPTGRLMLLHHLEEEVQLDDLELLGLRPGFTVRRQAPLVEFSLVAGLPQWVFDLGDGAQLEQTIFMPHALNSVHAKYRLIGPHRTGVLIVRPWVDIRLHEELQDTSPDEYETSVRAPAAVECGRNNVNRRVCLAASDDGSVFQPSAAHWQDFVYVMERDRGYDNRGSMHSPGLFRLPLVTNRAVYLTASSEPWVSLGSLPPDAAWNVELARREDLVGRSHSALRSATSVLLPLAADQFLIQPPARDMAHAAIRASGAEPRTVIAGYPWFTDWGRDTMISLEGLALATGRFGEARDILTTFAHAVRRGLIPNLFPEGMNEGRYHTADATLWFFHALHRYDVITGDEHLVNEVLPVLEDIVRCHRQGTDFGIRVDADGLLTQGDMHWPLTWMDAKVSDWIVTPRRGKTVEVNALWHNALVLLSGWLARNQRLTPAGDISNEARRCREAFNDRFWNASTGHLFDLIDGERGDDASCRPNQLFAIALPNPVLDRVRWVSVLSAVENLVTPYGLRTLSPTHPDFQARYFGDLRARDAAYHQGTVWPWLIGPYVDAWLAAYPDDVARVTATIQPLLDHLAESACVGSLSEIFDAAPPYTPRGCFAQAWSVAEIARLVVKASAATHPQRHR